MGDIETRGDNIFPFSWVKNGDYLKQLFEGNFDPSNYKGNIKTDIYRAVESWITGYITNLDTTNTSQSPEELITKLEQLGLIFQLSKGEDILDTDTLVQLAGNKYSHIDAAQIISESLKVLNDIFPNQLIQEYIYSNTIFVYASGLDGWDDYIRVGTRELQTHRGFKESLQTIARKKMKELAGNYFGKDTINDRVEQCLDGEGI